MTINGRSYDWGAWKMTISYEEVALLTALPTPSVTYRYAATGARGILHPGDRLAIGPDLVVNAARTGNA